MTCGFFWRIKNAIELSYVLETVCLINKHLSDGDQNAFHHGTWPEKRRNVRQSARRIRVYKHLLYQLPLFLFTPHLLNYSPKVRHILGMTCGFSGKLKRRSQVSCLRTAFRVLYIGPKMQMLYVYAWRRRSCAQETQISIYDHLFCKLGLFLLTSHSLPRI
jgi:hypothetical protein